MAGEYIAALYNQMEEEVIADIARRVRKTDRFTETAEIMAKALRAQGYSPDRIQVEVMKKLNTDNVYLQYVANETRAYKQEVKQIIAQTVADAAAAGDALTAAAGEMSWNDDLQIWADHGVDLKKDNTLRQIQKAFTDQTVGELKNITRTSALFVGGVPILDAYHHELDLAIVKIASGAFTFGQAMDDCCRRLGGGAQVIYPSGRKYSIEAAARMTLKTGLSQMAGRITERNIEKTGVDFVFVQAHAGARPEHAEWQGKVYTYKGKPSKQYPDFFEATGYGTVTGLKGVNCSHEFYPWWPGDPIPEFKEPEPVTIDGKSYSFYEATQEQRKMERDVRNMKREAAAAKAAGNTERAEKLEAKIKETRREYTEFSKAAGLRPKTERMKVYGSAGTKVTIPTSKQLAEKTKSLGAKKTRGLSAGKGDDIIKPHPLPDWLGKMDYNDDKAVSQLFADFRQKALYLEEEKACVVMKDGNVYICHGVGNQVWPEELGEEKLKGAKITHNHPMKYTHYTLDSADINLYNNLELEMLEGFDEKYIYRFSRKDKHVDLMNPSELTPETIEINGTHIMTGAAAQQYGFGYRRIINNEKR